MAYDEYLAERIRRSLQGSGTLFEEKKMMGGLTFMINEKMCVGIVKNDLMARVGPGRYEEALAKPGCREMDFTGKPMKGYVFVGAEGMDKDQDLDQWIAMSLEFNRELTGN